MKPLDIKLQNWAVLETVARRDYFSKKVRDLTLSCRTVTGKRSDSQPNYALTNQEARANRTRLNFVAVESPLTTIPNCILGVMNDWRTHLDTLVQSTRAGAANTQLISFTLGISIVALFRILRWISTPSGNKVTTTVHQSSHSNKNRDPGSEITIFSID